MKLQAFYYYTILIFIYAVLHIVGYHIYTYIYIYIFPYCYLYCLYISQYCIFSLYTIIIQTYFDDRKL